MGKGNAENIPRVCSCIRCCISMKSFALCSRLLEVRGIPESDRERILSNRDFAVPHALGETLAYDAAAVLRLTTAQERRPKAPAHVTLTITSCRRLHLFEKTVNSFLSCCGDLEAIGRWICIDDGSSEEDRRRMEELYPFFEFVFKEPSEKGHAKSMVLRRFVWARADVVLG